MKPRALAGAVGAWLVLLVVMVTNGVVRVTVLQPQLGEAPARRVATLVGVALVLALSWAYARRAGALAPRELLLVGVVWLVLTLVFEFGMGLVAGRSWTEMLVDYDLTRGRLWPLVLVATLLGPWAWGRLLRPSP
jgi:hypothetical protein